jgi:predicted anti-sigma-YlaC factor YlaD
MSEDTLLTCKEVVEIVTDYLEGTMSPELRERFEDHLSACEGCSAYLVQMRETIRLTGMLTEDEIPQEQRDRLLSTFRDWHRE